MSDATIVVVDDEARDRNLLTDVLEAEGYTAIAAESAPAALDILARTCPDLLLVDVMMPGMDGIELCRRLKGEEATRLVPLVLVTGLSGSVDRIRGIEAGADDFLSKPVHLAELRARVRSLLRLKRYTDQLEHAEALLYSLALGVEAKDPALEGHCARLAYSAAALGQALGLDAGALEALRRGGVLHDLGKIGIPDAILFKPGPLTPDEWQVMREHPVIGERICQSLKSMQDVLPIIRHHHERWNGSGYPDGLAGPAIPLTARILQVADAFDALTTVRAYRQPLTPAGAFDVLRTEVARGCLDGELVDLFTRLWATGGLHPDRVPALRAPTAAGPTPAKGPETHGTDRPQRSRGGHPEHPERAPERGSMRHGQGARGDALPHRGRRAGRRATRRGPLRTRGLPHGGRRQRVRGPAGPPGTRPGSPPTWRQRREKPSPSLKRRGQSGRPSPATAMVRRYFKRSKKRAPTSLRLL